MFLEKMYTGNRFRSCDLGVMSPARCRCAMPVVNPLGQEATIHDAGVTFNIF